MNSPKPRTYWTRPETTGPEVFVAVPEGVTPPATVAVGMELFGVTAWVRGVCEQLAAAGYAAVAPDFFGRTVPRADLPYDAAGRDEGFRLLSALTADQVATDTAAALSVGASLGAGPGRAFAGFSAGGHLAFVAGTRLPLDLIVACYPGWLLDADTTPFTAAPQPPLTPTGAATLAAHGTTVLGLVGTEDHLVPPIDWSRIDARLTESEVPHELVSYPDTPHGFLCPDRPATFRPTESADAWSRILAALATLKP
ncbi:dienelactone hydrolase family protein [Kitasatospora sp. NPDC004615]|uniref:dienelactone hydrolase family protein n=1 Tax=Kitasatospora sp. NPDC004615 TaxID=3364017 RepID=UPI003673646E